jgi:hypothetical protein
MHALSFTRSYVHVHCIHVSTVVVYMYMYMYMCACTPHTKSHPAGEWMRDHYPLHLSPPLTWCHEMVRRLLSWQCPLS